MYLHYSDGTLNRQVYWAAHGPTEEVVRLLGEGAIPIGRISMDGLQCTGPVSTTTLGPCLSLSIVMPT